MTTVREEDPAPYGPTDDDPTDDDIIKKAIQILARRIKKAGFALTSPNAVKDYLKLHFAGHEAESFVVLFCDVKHRIIKVESMFTGTLTHTSVYPREVVKAALRHNAAAVILAHNHPSGVADPSEADLRLTRALVQALGLIDVRVLDHVVVAGTETHSFAENGQL